MSAQTATLQTPKRPVLRYHGGKWRIAPWVISHFPPHDVYLEPFGGGASVLMRKPRVKGEVYNDLDGEIVNVFRVLRNECAAQRLARLLYLTPYGREDFYASYSGIDNDDVERARLTITRSFMGHGSNAVTRKARHGFRSKRAGNWYPSHEWERYPEEVRTFSERLRGVVIENRDALLLMRQHDAEGVLHYVDPPYLASLRNKSLATSSYRHEMSDADHEVLCNFLRTLSGYVVLSGYQNEIYADILTGWATAERDTMAEAAKRTREVLWLSPNVRQSRQAALPGVG